MGLKQGDFGAAYGMSMIELTELKNQLVVLSPAERREVLEFLKEMESGAQGPRGAVSVESPGSQLPAEWANGQEKASVAHGKVRSFEDALDYTFANFDNALRKLAQ